MKNKFTLLLVIIFFSFMLCNKIVAQAFEWRLTNPTFNSTDPDGTGPATGSISFTMQMRTRTPGASIPITGMSTGFLWQSANAMLPTGVPCANSVPQPSNIVMGSSFPGYTFNNLNHCSGLVNVTTGGQTFDRRAVGFIDGGSDIIITNTYVNVFTATLWSLNTINPQAGFVALNSTNAGNPGPFSNYDISDINAEVFDANSLTFATPLSLGSVVLSVKYAKINASCNDNGSTINWTTTSEINSDYFEVQRSFDGIAWNTTSKVKAKGNSSVETDYKVSDATGGTAFYRLKQVDVDGKFNISSIVSTNCNEKNTDVTIYPVPAQNELNLLVKASKLLNAQFEIYDATGRLVKRVNGGNINGTSNLKVDIASLAAGQYNIRSIDPSVKLNKNFTIIK